MNVIFRYPKSLVFIFLTGAFFIAQLVNPTFSCSLVFSFKHVASGLKYDRILAGNDEDAKNELLSYLQRRDDFVVGHERAHSVAFGRWAGGVKYFTYEAQGRKYALGGCAGHKLGVPLEVKYKSLLAPMKPSEPDKITAQFIQAAIYLRDDQLSEAFSSFGKAFMKALAFIGPTLLVVGSLALCVFVFFRIIL